MAEVHLAFRTVLQSIEDFPLFEMDLQKLLLIVCRLKVINDNTLLSTMGEDFYIYLRRFGERVRDLRKSQGISQERLAELADLHRTYIGAIERGERNVSLINILKLSKALKSSPSDLLREMTPVQSK